MDEEEIDIALRTRIDLLHTLLQAFRDSIGVTKLCRHENRGSVTGDGLSHFSFVAEDVSVKS